MRSDPKPWVTHPWRELGTVPNSRHEGLARDRDGSELAPRGVLADDVDRSPHFSTVAEGSYVQWTTRTESVPRVRHSSML